MKTMLFNPYTGTPRHPSDIASDPEGILLLDPDEPVRAAPTAAKPDCSGGIACTTCPDKHKCQRGCIRQGEALENPNRKDLRAECDAVDALLRGLGLDPERCRTEGGALNVGRTLSLLADGVKAKPVAWGMRWQGHGPIMDCITPEEHERHEGEYTVPLFATPPTEAKPATQQASGGREALTEPGRDLIAGVLRCAAWTHDAVGAPALAKQAREALETFKRAALSKPAQQERVSVPMKPTQAMRDVMDSEGWAWEDLLAAAEAITEDEHAILATPHTEAVRMSEAEINHLVDTHVGGPTPSYPLGPEDWINFARAIERAAIRATKGGK